MEKLETLVAGKMFRIVQYANGDEVLFFEPANYMYFRKLLRKHLHPVCEILQCELSREKVALILKFHEEAVVPEKYREKLYLPFQIYSTAIQSRSTNDTAEKEACLELDLNATKSKYDNSNGHRPKNLYSR
ncbi:MAG TPA: hypothetical protein VF676_11715 [Flavobacterium sp.]|jgi:hypothetical protein